MTEYKDLLTWRNAKKNNEKKKNWCMGVKSDLKKKNCRREFMKKERKQEEEE